MDCQNPPEHEGEIFTFFANATAENQLNQAVFCCRCFLEALVDAEVTGIQKISLLQMVETLCESSLEFSHHAVHFAHHLLIPGIVSGALFGERGMPGPDRDVSEQAARTLSALTRCDAFSLAPALLQSLRGRVLDANLWTDPACGPAALPPAISLLTGLLTGQLGQEGQAAAFSLLVPDAARFLAFALSPTSGISEWLLTEALSLLRTMVLAGGFQAATAFPLDADAAQLPPMGDILAAAAAQGARARTAPLRSAALLFLSAAAEDGWLTLQLEGHRPVPWDSPPFWLDLLGSVALLARPVLLNTGPSTATSVAPADELQSALFAVIRALTAAKGVAAADFLAQNDLVELVLEHLRVACLNGAGDPGPALQVLWELAGSEGPLGRSEAVLARLGTALEVLSRLLAHAATHRDLHLGACVVQLLTESLALSGGSKALTQAMALRLLSISSDLLPTAPSHHHGLPTIELGAEATEVVCSVARLASILIPCLIGSAFHAAAAASARPGLAPLLGPSLDKTAPQGRGTKQRPGPLSTTALLQKQVSSAVDSKGSARTSRPTGKGVVRPRESIATITAEPASASAAEGGGLDMGPSKKPPPPPGLSLPPELQGVLSACEAALFGAAQPLLYLHPSNLASSGFLVTAVSLLFECVRALKGPAGPAVEPLRKSWISALSAALPSLFLPRALQALVLLPPEQAGEVLEQLTMSAQALLSSRAPVVGSSSSMSEQLSGPLAQALWSCNTPLLLLASLEHVLHSGPSRPTLPIAVWSVLDLVTSACPIPPFLLGPLPKELVQEAASVLLGPSAVVQCAGGHLVHASPGLSDLCLSLLLRHSQYAGRTGGVESLQPPWDRASLVSVAGEYLVSAAPDSDSNRLRDEASSSSHVHRARQPLLQRIQATLALLLREGEDPGDVLLLLQARPGASVLALALSQLIAELPPQDRLSLLLPTSPVQGQGGHVGVEFEVLRLLLSLEAPGPARSELAHEFIPELREQEGSGLLQSSLPLSSLLYRTWLQALSTSDSRGSDDPKDYHHHALLHLILDFPYRSVPHYLLLSSLLIRSISGAEAQPNAIAIDSVLPFPVALRALELLSQKDPVTVLCGMATVDIDALPGALIRLHHSAESRFEFEEGSGMADLGLMERQGAGSSQGHLARLLSLCASLASWSLSAPESTSTTVLGAPYCGTARTDSLAELVKPPIAIAAAQYIARRLLPLLPALLQRPEGSTLLPSAVALLGFEASTRAELPSDSLDALFELSLGLCQLQPEPRPSTSAEASTPGRVAIAADLAPSQLALRIDFLRLALELAVSSIHQSSSMRPAVGVGVGDPESQQWGTQPGLETGRFNGQHLGSQDLLVEGVQRATAALTVLKGVPSTPKSELPYLRAVTSALHLLELSVEGLSLSSNGSEQLGEIRGWFGGWAAEALQAALVLSASSALDHLDLALTTTYSPSSPLHLVDRLLPVHVFLHLAHRLGLYEAETGRPRLASNSLPLWMADLVKSIPQRAQQLQSARPHGRLQDAMNSPPGKRARSRAGGGEPGEERLVESEGSERQSAFYLPLALAWCLGRQVSLCFSRDLGYLETETEGRFALKGLARLRLGESAPFELRSAAAAVDGHRDRISALIQSARTSLWSSGEGLASCAEYIERFECEMTLWRLADAL